MREYVITVHCKLEGKPRPFRLVAFGIEPAGQDRELVESVLAKTTAQGGTSCDPAGRRRDESVLLKTRYLGALSEVLLERYLQRELGAAYTVTNIPFSTYDAHVDLTVAAGEKALSVEVRGSFPFSRLGRVICELFDIIGPYTTGYKPGETAKDLYLRTLINQPVARFDPRQPHTLLFAGGAERAFMEQRGYETTFEQQNARYLAVKPIAAARDAVEIVDVIRTLAKVHNGSQPSQG